MWAIEQYFHVVLSVVMYEVIETLEVCAWKSWNVILHMEAILWKPVMI